MQEVQPSAPGVKRVSPIRSPGSPCRGASRTSLEDEAAGQAWQTCRRSAVLCAVMLLHTRRVTAETRSPCDLSKCPLALEEQRYRKASGQ